MLRLGLGGRLILNLTEDIGKLVVEDLCFETRHHSETLVTSRVSKRFETVWKRDPFRNLA